MQENKWRLLGHIVFRQKSRNGSKILSLLFILHLVFAMDFFSEGILKFVY